jgi:hypothetical protein
MSLIALFSKSLLRRVVFWGLLMSGAAMSPLGMDTAGAVPYQGFGATTPGGAGQAVVHVTTLADSGPGSLRTALSQGNRMIVFDVSGTITLSSAVKIKGAFITIDGFTAPPPGITLVNAGLYISGNDFAHDIIVQGLRIRNAKGDGITIRDSAYNIVIDHVSIQGAGDGSIDVTRNASDVTIQWCILAENVPTHNFLALVDYQALRITFYKNAFIKGQSRIPQSGWDPTQDSVPPDTVTDIRNNLIWDFIDYGTLVREKSRSNVVGNFYYSSTEPTALRALQVKTGGKVYANGNFSLNGANIDARRTQDQPFPAVPMDTTDACTAAQQIVASAGMRPLDAIDQQYLATITLPSAPCEKSTTPAPPKPPKKPKKNQ